MDPLSIVGVAAGVGSLLKMFGGPKEVPGMNMIPDFIRKRTQMGDQMASDIGNARITAQNFMNQKYRNLEDASARTAAQGASNLMGALGSGAENVVGSQLGLADYNQTKGMADRWKLASDMMQQNAALEQWNATEQNALKTAALNTEQQLLPTQLQMMQANAPTTTAGALGSFLSNAAGGIAGVAGAAGVSSFLNLIPQAKQAVPEGFNPMDILRQMSPANKAVHQPGGSLFNMYNNPTYP